MLSFALHELLALQWSLLDRCTMTMADRLRRARKDAGYRTASAAIENFKWPTSSYRAHENGQNNFSPETAQQYAEAYGANAAWLLLGDVKANQSRSSNTPAHKHDCIEHIRATTLLLKDAPKNIDLIDKLADCVRSLRAKAERR